MRDLLLVGTPGDRRVVMFAGAWARGGGPEPRVVAWRDVLGGGPVPVPEGGLVRVDSPGEDAATDAMLRGPGEPSRVGGGARWYRGFMAGLEAVRDAVARTPGARLLGDAGEIGVMFDKRVCHARLEAAGVPVPPALPGPPVTGYGELRERLGAAGWGRVFVKPAHGSSASGVIALQVNGDRVRAVTSAALDRPSPPGGPAAYNSLKVRVYGDHADVGTLVELLAPDGLHVERWFPKAGIGGRVFDLRVVVVAGTPTHAVVRASRTPMTNLHLGGVRGDLAAVRARLGEDGWARALDVCARAAACFPGSLAVGVDLMVGANWRDLAVAEVNAFGDLLPGLTGLDGSGAEGLDTYGAQVAAITAGRYGGAPVRPAAAGTGG
nr:STM4014 family protein [Bailinhaonella thermotolerans]